MIGPQPFHDSDEASLDLQIFLGPDEQGLSPMFDLELVLDSDEAFLCPDVGVSIDRLTLSPHPLLPGGRQCSFYYFGEYIITTITTTIINHHPCFRGAQQSPWQRSPRSWGLPALVQLSR